jgi:hypothetical protein
VIPPGMGSAPSRAPVNSRTLRHLLHAGLSEYATPQSLHPAGNRGRCGNCRETVLRLVLGRPVRPLVDAARAVRAAFGQPGHMGSVHQGCPSQAAGLAYNIQDTTLAGAAASLASESESLIYLAGRWDSSPTTSAITDTPARKRISPRRRPQGTAPQAEWLRVATSELGDLARGTRRCPAGRGPGGASHAGTRRVSVARSVALGTLWPYDPDGDPALPGIGNHVGGTSVAPSRLAIPDRIQLVGVVDHELASGHVRL